MPVGGADTLRIDGRADGAFASDIGQGVAVVVQLALGVEQVEGLGGGVVASHGGALGRIVAVADIQGVAGDVVVQVLGHPGRASDAHGLHGTRRSIAVGHVHGEAVVEAARRQDHGLARDGIDDDGAQGVHARSGEGETGGEAGPSGGLGMDFQLGLPAANDRQVAQSERVAGRGGGDGPGQGIERGGVVGQMDRDRSADAADRVGGALPRRGRRIVVPHGVGTVVAVGRLERGPGNGLVLTGGTGPEGGAQDGSEGPGLILCQVHRKAGLEVEAIPIGPGEAGPISAIEVALRTDAVSGDCIGGEGEGVPFLRGGQVPAGGADTLGIDGRAGGAFASDIGQGVAVMVQLALGIEQVESLGGGVVASYGGALGRIVAVAHVQGVAGDVVVEVLGEPFQAADAGGPDRCGRSVAVGDFRFVAVAQGAGNDRQGFGLQGVESVPGACEGVDAGSVEALLGGPGFPPVGAAVHAQGQVPARHGREIEEAQGVALGSGPERRLDAAEGVCGDAGVHACGVQNLKDAALDQGVDRGAGEHDASPSIEKGIDAGILAAGSDALCFLGGERRCAEVASGEVMSVEAQAEVALLQGQVPGYGLGRGGGGSHAGGRQDGEVPDACSVGGDQAAIACQGHGNSLEGACRLVGDQARELEVGSQRGQRDRSECGEKSSVHGEPWEKCSSPRMRSKGRVDGSVWEVYTLRR